MADQTTDAKVLLSQADFARMAARIGGRATTWAADTLDHCDPGEPISAETVREFLRQMRGALDQIERKIVEPADA